MKTFYFPLIALMLAASCAHAHNTSTPDPSAIIQAKLDSIVIPRTNLPQVPLERVVAIIEGQDTDSVSSPENPPLRIVIVDEGLKDIPVSIILRNSSLSKILDVVCASVGAQGEIKGDDVLISAGQAYSGDGDLKTEVFPLSRGTILGISSEAFRL